MTIHCKVPAAALLLLLGAAAPPVDGRLIVSIERLRNERGTLHLCLTRNEAHFPHCARDPTALKRSIAASSRTISFEGIEPGAYALSIVHDENSNGKLDTFVDIPREGFGFSRNPVIRFGAPKFRQVSIDLAPGLARQTVRMQYLL